jgi:hypothetical protein
MLYQFKPIAIFSSFISFKLNSKKEKEERFTLKIGHRFLHSAAKTCRLDDF